MKPDPSVLVRIGRVGTEMRVVRLALWESGSAHSPRNGGHHAVPP